MEDQESLTKTIAKGGILFSINKLIEIIISLVSGFLVIELLSVYDYGLWRLILSALSIFLIFTFPAITQITIYDTSVEYGKQNFKNYKAILKQYSYLSLGLGALLCLILFFSAPIISIVTGKNLTLFFQIVSFSILAGGIMNIYYVFFYSDLRLKTIAALKILSQVLNTVLIFIFLLFLKMGLKGMALAYTLPSLIIVFVFLPIFIKKASFLRKIEEGDRKIFWQGLKKHGKWALSEDYLTEFLANLRPWIIGYFLGVNSVAMFSIAQSFYGVVASSLPLDQVMKSVIPRTIADKEKFNRLFQKSIKYSTWIYTAFLIFSFIFAPTFIRIVFPKYIPATPLFYIFLFNLLPLGASVILSEVFYSLKAQKGLFTSSLVKVFSTSIILPLFILLFGVKGAVLEFTLSAYLLFLARYFMIKKFKPDISINLLELFKFDEYDKIMLSRIINKIKRGFK